MAHERSEPQDSLPTSIPERARRLLRTWQSIRPHDTTTHQAFKDFSSRLAQESPEHLDATVAAAATLLKDMDLQAGFRRDVMARMAHLEGLAEHGHIAVRADAFVLPMAGDLAAMQALTQCPQAFLRLVEGLSSSGRFETSDVSLLEVVLKPEAANSSFLAEELAHGIGMAMLADPSPLDSTSRPEELVLIQRLEGMRAMPQGTGAGVLAGVRVWFGPTDEAPDEGDLLLEPQAARARDQVETLLAWETVVAEVLALAELPPGSVTVLPPATFLRGLAQTRALEQLHGIHQLIHANGDQERFARMGTYAADDGLIHCVAHDDSGNLLAEGPAVSLAEIHAEGQCYLETFAREHSDQGPRTQQHMRRRGLH